MTPQRYSVPEHLAHSVFGVRYSREKLFAMLTAHFDESCGKSFVVMCGWIASVEEWDNFEIDWRLFLASYKVPYFHMTDFAYSAEPFKKWKNAPNFRARFIHDAWEIISSRVRKGFVCHVDNFLFNRVNQFYQLTEKFQSPYALVGRECIRWADNHARAAGEEVRCIFDDGGPDKGGLLSAASVEPKLPNPIFEPSRDIPDRKRGTRKGVVPIQSADFLAYEIGKYITDHPLYRGGQRAPRYTLRMVGRKRPDTKFFNERRLLGLCQEFSLRRRITNESQQERSK